MKFVSKSGARAEVFLVPKSNTEVGIAIGWLDHATDQDVAECVAWAEAHLVAEHGAGSCITGKAEDCNSAVEMQQKIQEYLTNG